MRFLSKLENLIRFYVGNSLRRRSRHHHHYNYYQAKEFQSRQNPIKCESAGRITFSGRNYRILLLNDSNLRYLSSGRVPHLVSSRHLSRRFNPQAQTTRKCRARVRVRVRYFRSPTHPNSPFPQNVWPFHHSGGIRLHKLL